MNLLTNKLLLGLIKDDKVGKYYLVDSDKFVNKDFDGLTRIEMYTKLVRVKAINERKSRIAGIDMYLEYVNKLLDGIFYIGRFKIYRVSNFTLSLEEQMYDERMRYIKEG